MNTWLIAALWMGLALAAALGSVQFGISVALVEILLGFLAGNTFHLNITLWIDFLAGTGSVLLTFLAGAEIDPEVLRANFRESLSIGFFSFLAPALGAFAAAYRVFGWDLHAAEIAGLALSTTSVAVVYAVTCITKFAEGQASEQTIMAIAGHLSRAMLEHYSHIRMAAKRAALEGIAKGPEPGVFGAGVHQNVHQVPERTEGASSKSLN